jgi:hypothetical protein
MINKVSIVMPLYNPKEELVNQIIETVNKQKFNGDVEIITVRKEGLANAINYGVSKA